jgi:hypothetical protein
MAIKNTSTNKLDLNTAQRYSLQNGTIPAGVTSPGSKYPMNVSDISIYSPNDYLGPTFSPYYPVLTLTENFQVSIDGDWTGKIKSGDLVEITRGSIRQDYIIQRSRLSLTNGVTETILSFFTNRESVALLDPFIATSGYINPASDTFIVLGRKIENPNVESELLRSFSAKLYNDPRYADSFLASVSWEIDPSVSATRLRWRSVPRISFQSDLAFTVDVPGNYSQIPSVSIISNTGRGAQISLSGSIDAVAIAAGGTGYTTASVEAVGGGGTGASFSVSFAGTTINNISVASGGSGYTSVPALVISGDGTGASATFGMLVDTVSIIQQGGGYISTPTVSVDDTYLTGTELEISSQLSLTNEGRVDYIRVVNSGSGYTGASVSITGSAYSDDATATAQIINGEIRNIILNYTGYGYTGASVNITPTGTGGTGAVAIANVDLYSQWVYESPLYTEKTFTLSGLKYNVPYEVEILVSPDRNFRGILNYSSPVSFFYLK